MGKHRNKENLGMNGKQPHYLVLVIALVAMGFALLAVACGESDDTSETTSPTEATEVTEATESAAGTSGNVLVKGLVDNPMTLTIDTLEGMNVVDMTVDHPKLGLTDYRGVRFTELFAAMAVQDSASAIVMAASDGYMVEIPLGDLKASEDAILALGDDGTITVVIPDMATKNWVKDVVSMEFK
jgi:hypothetical protein